MISTLVLGASKNPERFSNRAIRKLLAANHPVIPVSLKGGLIQGLQSLTDVEQVNTPINTVTIYLRPSLLEKELEKIIALSPTRVIFNPGTESETAIKRLTENNISVVQQCTLIMLDQGIYE